MTLVILSCGLLALTTFVVLMSALTIDRPRRFAVQAGPGERRSAR